MADIDKNPATLLDELAALDPLTRSQVASAMRNVADMFAGVPHGRHTAYTLRLLAHWLDPSARVLAIYCGVPAEPPCQRRRWPRLIPIVESVIRKGVPLGDDSWVSLRSALQDEQVRQTVEAIPPPGLASTVSTQRVLDAATWCVTAGPETPGRHERQPGSAEHLLPGQLAEVGAPSGEAHASPPRGPCSAVTQHKCVQCHPPSDRRS